MALYQIRAEGFGLRLVEAESAAEALIQFGVDRAKSGLRSQIETDAQGPFLMLDGVEHRAVNGQEAHAG